jgi:uncharacterized protein with HEPN domain
MNKTDANLLRLIFDAAQEASSFIKGKTRSDLHADRMLVLALVKSIETIGEIASKVSGEGKAECDGIPWGNIIDAPNYGTRIYFTIDPDIVWQTVTGELPSLVSALEKCLASSAVE